MRVAVEVPGIENIYLNDTNFIAIEATKGAELNQVKEKCYYSINEVCKFLTEHSTLTGERFDIIDLDPFGTQAPFVDCVLRSILDGGFISVMQQIQQSYVACIRLFVIVDIMEDLSIRIILMK